MDLANKVIMIVGASSGIGKSLAQKLVEKKSKLIILARSFDKLEKIKEENPNAEIDIYKCDVSNKTEVKLVFEEVKRKNNFIDMVILNSAVSHRMKVENFNSELAEETISINFLGMIYCIEQILPIYLKEKKGIIVGVSSLADNRGYSGSGFYCASKSAVTTYLEGLSVELKNHNVKVITIKPGFVKTPMTDKNEFEMPFLMDSDKASEVIIKGLEKEKRFIQFPFPTVIGSKIIGIIPNRLYEYLSYKFNIVG